MTIILGKGKIMENKSREMKKGKIFLEKEKWRNLKVCARQIFLLPFLLSSSS